MKRIFRKVLAVISAFFFLATSSPLWAANVYTEGSTIVFDNKFIRYEVSQSGQSMSLMEKTSGKEYLDKSAAQNFMYVKKSGVETGASKVTLEKNILNLEFGNTGITGKIKVDARDDCFIIELMGVKGTGVDVFGMARLHLNIVEHVGSTLNVASNENFGVCLLGLNLITHAEGERGGKTALGISCIPTIGMAGAKFAFIGLPVKQILPLIGKLEQEFGLPHPLINGEWDKISKGVKTSYLFTDGNQTNIDSCIHYAEAGGFKYIMLLGGCFTSYGHYQVNTKMFPDGFQGLKATMKKIHDAGLKGGIHFLVGWISKNDSYVTPVPDGRLAKDGKLTLAKDIDDKSDFIPTVESPQGYPTETNPIGNGGHELQVGDELIIYSGLSVSPPYGFSGCKRGAYGTKIAAHSKDMPVYHMLETWGHYVVGAETGMLKEMTSAMGKVINECEVDMIYFDGAETMSSLGPGWYYIGKVLGAYYGDFKREVLYQGSAVHTFSWHIYSRGNSDDWVALGLKKFLDRHKVTNRVQDYHNNLLPGEFGWWGYFVHTPSVNATLPDEVEYGYSKGAGYDTPMGLEADMRDLAGNGRTGEILAMAKRWENIRLTGNLPEKIKTDLRLPGQEHTLWQEPSGEWNIHRITYAPDQIVKSSLPSSSAWKFNSAYRSQPLRIRIRAQSHQAAYGDSKNIILTDFAAANDFKSRVASPDLNISLSVSTDQVKVGAKSWKITGSNKSAQKSGWAELEYRYAKPLNLVKNRAIGTWVYGDGSGALLNISIVERQGVMRRDHYVDLNFSGWKYFEFSEPEVERVYEYKWPYSVKWPTRPIRFDEIGRIDLFLNEIPANKTVTCFVSPVEALADQPTVISELALSIGSNSITFPAVLHDDEYLEYWGSGMAKVYNPNNFLLKEIEPQGSLTIVGGANDVSFSCKTGNDFRAQITVITVGEALK